MALWGNIDGKHLTATTIIVGSNNTIEGYSTLVGNGTSFTTELNEGDLIIVDQTGPAGPGVDDPLGNFGVIGDTFRVVRIHDDTNLTIDSVHENGIPVPDGTDCGYVVYQQAPKYTDISNMSDPDAEKVMGADVTETAESGKLSHAGWVVRHPKIRDGVTSYWYETLVASSSISDDVPTPAAYDEL